MFLLVFDLREWYRFFFSAGIDKKEIIVSIVFVWVSNELPCFRFQLDYRDRVIGEDEKIVLPANVAIRVVILPIKQAIAEVVWIGFVEIL